jgi:hypothetical protein
MTINSQFTFDARDEQLRQQGLDIWNGVQEPRVGDYVQLACGTPARISLISKDQFQVAEPRFGASYYWAWWYCSFSGGHKPVLYPRASLEETGSIRDGDVWVFHHDEAGAHRGVSCTIPCRVYRLSINR